MPTLSVLCLGDVVGNPGREALKRGLKPLQEQFQPDFTVVNVENSAGGFGITLKIYDELCSLPIDLFTSGNHIFDKKEAVAQFDKFELLVRPYNWPSNPLGKGWLSLEKKGKKLAVLQLIGRAFMPAYDCPFKAADSVLETIKAQTPCIVVDFHAEATSEKQALGWYLDGRVSCVYGTHTHVMTADDRLLEKGTAYISDIGMTGATNGILGMEKDPIIGKFLNQMPTHFEPVKHAKSALSGIFLTLDQESGKALSIERIQRDIC